MSGKGGSPVLARAPRLLAELFVIALGVSLGLAADAAWEARKDRVRESEYLTSLRAEM